LLLVWDPAAWHISQEVTAWIVAHNRTATAGAAVRIVSHPLPSMSPWGNPMAPQGVHGTQRSVESARLLTMDELETRVYADLGAGYADHLPLPETAA
jgi:hypothetical protein